VTPKPVIRCSGLDQLFECPASLQIQARVSRRDSEESSEGTYLHHAIATRLVNELGATPPEGGLPPPDVPESYMPSGHSDWIIDYCFRRAQETIPQDWALEVETAFAYEFPRFILAGHPDLLAVNPAATRSKAKDWKSGYHAVDAADVNNQCLGYLVLTKLAYPTLESSEFEIVQPRANEDEGEQRVSTVVVEGAALDDAVAYLERRVNDALDRADEINSGLRQCRWCAAARPGGCPAWEAEVESMKMKLTPQALAEITRDPTNQALADLVVSARIIKPGIEDAEEKLKERLKDGQSVMASSGVCISVAEQNAAYSVTNPGGLYSALCTTLPTAERAKVIDVSTTKLREAIARTMNIPKTGKAPVTAESVFADRFKPHLKQGTRRVFKFS